MQPELIKKLPPIREVTRQTYDEMPEQFSVLRFCQRVRRKLRKPTMDGTILRRLRELREVKICDYEVIDKVNGIYKKKQNDNKPT